MTATITLDGKEVTGVTLEGVRITRGKESLFDDIAPGFCVAEMLSGDIAPDAWQGVSGYTDTYTDTWQGSGAVASVGSVMQVSTAAASGYTDTYTDTWTGGGAVRFTGLVTSVDYTPPLLTVTAVDALESLSRVYTNTAFPASTDVTRAKVLVNESGGTIAPLGSLEVGLIPQVQREDPVTVFNAVLEVAANNDAQVYATKENALVFRTRDVPPDAVVVLPSDVTLVEDLVVSQELGAVYNIERVEYGTDQARNTVEVTDRGSIEVYGRREWRTMITQLASANDAAQLAKYWLTLDARVDYTVENVSVVIDDMDGNWHAVADQMDLFVSVTVPYLPKGSPIASYQAVVLGYTERITREARTVDLTLAPPTYLTGRSVL